MGDEQARYWGVLNELRACSVAAYAEYMAWQSMSAPAALRRTGRLAYGLGSALLVLGAAAAVGLTAAGELGPTALIPVVSLLGLGGALLVAGGVSLRGARFRADARAAYLADEPQRARRQATLAALAERWSGRLEADGIEPGARWLGQHWPDRAPTALLMPYENHGEERTTLTGLVDGHPVLVQLVDFWPPTPTLDPPLLLLLVAAALDPAHVAGDTRDSAAGRRLVDAGFRVVAWNRAGAYALHPHPVDPLLDGPDGVPRCVGALIELTAVAASPDPPPPAPQPLPGDRPTDPEPVTDAFLSALAARDAVGALAHADPLLFHSQSTEPTADDLDRAIDGANARPLLWQPTRRTRGDGRSQREQVTKAHVADGTRSRLAVHLVLTDGRWRVQGYTAGYRAVLGHPYPDE